MAAAGMMALATPAAAQPLSRSLSSYFIFASKFAKVKNLKLNSACNVGVNCAAAPPKKRCGELFLNDVEFANGSQAVGDLSYCTKPGAILWQLFTNTPGSSCSTNVTLNNPPIQPFNPTPIIANTCAPGCLPDVAALEAACGFPIPFPACDPNKPVTVREAQDCDGPGVVDSVPNNGICDLPPGTYGRVTVRNGGTVQLQAGDYNVCSFKVARRALVNGPGAVLNIDDGGFFRVGGLSKVGLKCGDLQVYLKGTKGVRFGRNSTIGAKVCAPGSPIKLGHANNLLGQFIGDSVGANRDNRGECCGTKCACFDSFAPTNAPVGGTVTLTSNCDLTKVTAARICGIPANITMKTPNELKLTVPAGAAGNCVIEVDSGSGTFEAFATLSVP